MDQIETLEIVETGLDSARPEEGYMKADHIVEWHVQTETNNMPEGAVDGCGCGGCGCGCGGCAITL